MASFPHKLIAQVPFKGGGNLFHKLLRFNPLHFCNAAPTYIQAFEVLQGDCGVNGSTVQWKYSVGMLARPDSTRLDFIFPHFIN